MIKKDYILLLCIFFAGVIYLSELLQKFEYSTDDTFIYLQYARNLAEGNGFSFNPGESSYGVTGPFWVFLLVTAYLTGVDPFWFSKFLDLIFAVVSVIVFFKLARKFFVDEIFSYVATFIFCLNPWFVRWSFTGMETSLAVLLVNVIFYLYYTGRIRLMFFSLGIFMLVRPEAFLLLVIMTGFVVYRKIKTNEFNIKEFVIWIILSTCLFVPFLIYAWFTFGTVAPNTVSGKSGSDFGFEIFYMQLYEIIRTLAGSSFPELLLSFFFIAYVIFKKIDKDKYLPLILWIVGLVLVYVFTDADIISRYLLIISPFLILLGLEFIQLFSVKFKNVLIISLVVGSLLYSQFVFYKFVKPSTDDFTRGVNECFKPMGMWIKENTPNESKILLNDVGVIGYYSQRYIIDAAALINRDLELNRKIMSYSLEKRSHPFKMLDDIETDYIVERDTSEMNNLTEYGDYRFELKFVRKFPSLGIKDSTPRFYKLYKVMKKYEDVSNSSN